MRSTENIHGIRGPHGRLPNPVSIPTRFFHGCFNESVSHDGRAFDSPGNFGSKTKGALSPHRKDRWHRDQTGAAPARRRGSFSNHPASARHPAGSHPPRGLRILLSSRSSHALRKRFLQPPETGKAPL